LKKLSVQINALQSFIAKKDSGIKALFVTNMFGNILRLVSNLILARLLSPDTFALTGLAITIVFALEMMSDGGVRPFILRHKSGDQAEFLQTTWTIQLIRNFLLTTLLFFSAETLAEYFKIGELEDVLKVLCITVLLRGFVQIGYIALERQYKIALILYIQFWCNTFAIIFMVVGVYFTESYWPIVFSSIVRTSLQIFLGHFFIGYHGTGFRWDSRLLFEFLGWAKYIIPSSFITLIIMQVDKLVLGSTLSTTELGLYFVAFSLSSAVYLLCHQYVKGVLQAYLSIVYRETPSQYIEKYYRKKNKLISLLSFGIGLLCGASYLFFWLLYDERYLSSAYYLQFLLIRPVFLLFTYSSEVTLLLLGQLRATLIVNIIRLLWLAAAMPLGYHYLGVLGLLLSIALIELCPAVYLIVKLKMIGMIKIRKEIIILVPAIIGFCIAKSGEILIM
jgi:O-antigen/teichoic acid export membrane protein